MQVTRKYGLTMHKEDDSVASDASENELSMNQYVLLDVSPSSFKQSSDGKHIMVYLQVSSDLLNL